MEHKKFNVEVADGNVEISLDTNQDGDKLVKLELNMTEALQEIIARGGAIEGAKVVEVKFELTKLKVVLDTDKDGEKLMTLTIDLAEVLDEIASAAKK